MDLATPALTAAAWSPLAMAHIHTLVQALSLPSYHLVT